MLHKKKGFVEGYRHFIRGCHLKGHFRGVFLSIVSIDVNSGIFPLAIYVCKVENIETWGYFIKLLHEFFGDVESITFMSDRQKGLINALLVEWPTVRSRYCARHLFANFRKNFPRIHLRNLFWSVCRALNKIDF